MGVFAGPDIIEEDLTFVVDAANIRSYPGSGSTWFDISGRENDGTLTNSGNIAHAGGPARLKFNEGNTAGTGYVEMGNVIESTDKYTKNVWFRTNASNTNNLMSGGHTVLWCAGGQQTIYAGHNGSYYEVSYNSGSSTGLQTWYNACVTYSATTLKLYVNGKLRSTSSSTNYTDVSLHIAGFANQYELSGDIAYASLYDRALTASEVKQNYEAIKGRFGTL